MRKTARRPDAATGQLWDTCVRGSIGPNTSDIILQKLQGSDVRADELQQELQEQRKEVKDMGEKMNAVLAEMQAVSLQFDILSGAGMDFTAENTEGANWNLNDEPMDQKSAPPVIPL